MRRPHIVFASTMALALITFLPGAAFAQAPPATPAATPMIVLPITPDAADCQAEPRPVSFFTDAANELLATPVAMLPAAPGSPTPAPTPDETGIPADAATVHDVTLFMIEAIACVGTGDILRLTSLFTDEAAAEALTEGFGASIQRARQSGSRTFASADELLTWVFGTPQPAYPDATLVAVDDVRVLPDGRISAIITRSTSELVVTSQWVLERDGDRLLGVSETILSYALK